LTEHLALLNKSLNRATDVETGLATQQSIGAANERLGLLQTVLRNLKNKVSGFHDATLTAEKKLQLAYRAVFQAEYDRIADSIRPELHDLSAIAATLAPSGAVLCPSMNLKGAFPFLKEPKEGALEKISARLGLPVKIPKAVPVVGV